jgi:energy-coupling factor transport system ATP-binding protein
MIDICDLRYRLLHIDHLKIPHGITTIIGPNGSGKTTLLRLLAGITVPESGTILIDRVPPRKTEVGWVNEFPDRNILFSIVYDEIASPLRFRYTATDEIPLKVDAVVKRLGIQHLISRKVRELSGGEKVLVALAAALVFTPGMLVLDEYDTHLDGARCSQVGHLLSASGCEYVLRCSQNMETAATSDFLILLDKGNLVHAGDPAEVFEHLSGTPYYPLSLKVGL